jgi:hypothetical protein
VYSFNNMTDAIPDKSSPGRVTELLFGWGLGAVSGRCDELGVFDEAEGVMEFTGSLYPPYGKSYPLPLQYLPSTHSTSYGWKFAMVDSIDQSKITGGNDGGFYDEEYGGHIVLFPTYDVRVKFRTVTIEEYLAAVEAVCKEEEDMP